MSDSTSRNVYEVRWGDSRGNSTSIDLPGLLEVELVQAIAMGVREWWLRQPNYTKEKRFVSVHKVESQTVVTPVKVP
jgi:hypothetical protein